MKVLLTADLHGSRRHYEWIQTEVEDGDYQMLVVAGDLLDLFQYPRIRPQLALIRTFVKSLPPELIVLLCSGNHDTITGDRYLEYAQWFNELRRPNVYLDGDVLIWGGRSFECVPWGRVPKTDPEFIVCHSPPFGSKTARAPNGDHGDPEIADHLRQSGGTVLCGHVHDAAGWYDLRHRFRSINPCNDLLLAEPSVVVLDLKTNTATRGHQTIQLD